MLQTGVQNQIRWWLTLYSVARFLQDTGHHFQYTTYLGGYATGNVQTQSSSSGRTSGAQIQGQADVQAAVAEAGFSMLAEQEQGRLLSSNMTVTNVSVSGGNDALQTQGKSGRKEWLMSLKQPAQAQLLRGNIKGEQELLPLHYFLQQALIHGRVRLPLRWLAGQIYLSFSQAAVPYSAPAFIRLFFHKGP